MNSKLSAFVNPKENLTHPKLTVTSTIKPSRILPSLMRDSVEPVKYQTKNTNDDEHKTFLPSTVIKKVLNGRYLVDRVVDKEGATSVVLGCRDLSRPCVGVRSESQCNGSECSKCSRVVIKVLHGSYAEVGRREAATHRALCAADPQCLSNIVRFLDQFMFGPHECLVIEYVSSSLASDQLRQGLIGSASGELDKQSGIRLINVIRQIAFKVTVALGFLRWTNVIHSDLKPENILISIDTESRLDQVQSVKLIDFGNAFYDTFEDLSSFFEDFELQTLLYRAPEVLFGIAGFDASIDMWSLGVTLAEMYLGRSLFCSGITDPTAEDITEAITDLLGPLPKDFYRKGAYFEELSHFTGDHETLGDVVERLCNHLGTRNRDFVDFVAQCLHPIPFKRLSPAQAALHPFLAPIAPFGFLTEPKFTSRNNLIPYQNAHCLKEYQHSPTKAVGSFDPTLVRSLCEERVQLEESHILIHNSSKDESSCQKDESIVEPVVPSSTQIQEEAQQKVFGTPKNSRIVKKVATTPSAKELIAMLDVEEQRFKEAQILRDSLKRTHDDL